ncbi:MAG: hypothetical protein CO065_05145 [Comamonadaceae bacterium CG_4_9_14_0_8_um_filter_57_21]|nr:MAG: hypothetical protein COY49_10000 [Comamonadaceae bacterium CG_4_10_14_0_8_um_filter_57_29]PJC20581.1 MAG: hypothetical protein CO065_05145 [Comamonadaceae bacterium CG_4_9_14_0_8_um_filter_57_21]
MGAKKYHQEPIMQTLNLEQLKAATQAGGITGITLRGDGAAFVVSVQTQRGEAVMVTTRRQPRRFTDPRKALQVLRGLGWHQCQVDAAQWRPEEHALEKVARPDRSAALKAAHVAAQADADYDRWFHAKVQASIDGIKDGSNRLIPEEEWGVRRAALIARIKARQALTAQAKAAPQVL